ncbi:MAG: glycosyltransferase [Kiritimatiellae bacterium]|nr:glycosyltransferase [Kiritimatiellia bacterium]
MKVSVIVPVFNTSKYLARCLDSILSQTQKDFELIAINDGSSDNSAEILSQYASRDSRIIIVTQRNKGLSAARNSGLKIARGEWIMFVDSDDFIPCDAIEKFLLAADESKESVVISKEYLLDDAPAARSEKVQWKRCAPALKELIKLRKAQSSAWNKFYSAALLKNRRFIEGIYFEDWPFNLELFGNIESFALLDEEMYVYCRNRDSSSILRSAFTLKKVSSYLEGIRRSLEKFRRHPQRKYALARIATAVKMLVAKTWKQGDQEARQATVLGVNALIKEGLLPKNSLTLKTRLRLWLLSKTR